MCSIWWYLFAEMEYSIHRNGFTRVFPQVTSTNCVLTGSEWAHQSFTELSTVCSFISAYSKLSAIKSCMQVLKSRSDQTNSNGNHCICILSIFYDALNTCCWQVSALRRILPLVIRKLKSKQITEHALIVLLAMVSPLTPSKHIIKMHKCVCSKYTSYYIIINV